MFFNLFVKNFPPGTTEEELKEFFMRAIPNEHDDVITKITPIKGTCQAFVNFTKQDACRACKDFCRNSLFKGVTLYVDFCIPSELRKIKNEEL